MEPSPAADWTEGTVVTNGVRFAYLEQGRGPLALLLHGFPDTAHTWDRVGSAVARAGFRAVCPFMRGYWPSALAPDGRYDLDSIAADAIALIGALGAERAVMIGHDWGASAALGAAILAPERVAFLITAAVPHPAAILPLPRILWGLRHFWTLRRRDAVDRLRADDFALVDRLVRRWSPAWSPPPEETAAVKEAFRQPGCLEAAVGYYRALKFPPPAWSRRAVSVPSAALCGTEDGVLAVADFERARHRYANGYTVVALPGGHFLHREHPDAFITALGKVLPSPEAVRSPAHQGRDLTQGHDSAPS